MAWLAHLTIPQLAEAVCELWRPVINCHRTAIRIIWRANDHALFPIIIQIISIRDAPAEVAESITPRAAIPTDHVWTIGNVRRSNIGLNRVKIWRANDQVGIPIKIYIPAGNAVTELIAGIGPTTPPKRCGGNPTW